jgi:hypothetical protein
VSPLMNRGLTLAVLLIISHVFVATPAGGEMGYDVMARVGGSAFEIHRSTQDFNYETKEIINGSGLFSRYSHLEGFGGIDAREDTSTTKPSRLELKSQLLLKSREGPVKFSVNMGSGINTSYNESNITLVDAAQIEIDERWPTYLVRSKGIKYFGKGIRSRERFDNNGDIVDSYVWSWKLSQDSLYQSNINRSLISANIYPERVEVLRLGNRSSTYKLDLKSVGSLTHFGAYKNGEGDKGNAYFSGDYTGDQKMVITLKMGESLIKPDEDSDVGMWCCS